MVQPDRTQMRKLYRHRKDALSVPNN